MCLVSQYFVKFYHGDSIVLSYMCLLCEFSVGFIVFHFMLLFSSSSHCFHGYDLENTFPAWVILCEGQLQRI